MRVALAHDSFTQSGGAERVVLALHEMYPDAPIFTLAYDPEVLRGIFEGSPAGQPVIIASPLQYAYRAIGKLQWLLPFMPAALRAFDLTGFDLLVSSSSMFMKGMRVPRGCVHVQYCHTPPRFLWTERGTYSREEVPAILRWLRIDRAVLGWLKRWDRRAASRVTAFVANSKNVQRRIRQFYGRESEVVYPFVDTTFFYPSKPKEDYFLVAGRLQRHKRVDIVVDVFSANGRQLHVVGDGRARGELSSRAAENVTFLGRVDDEILRDEYSGAAALIFPHEEDLGMVPLEAMACGTPVIAYRAGGVLETVVEGKTGLFFAEQTRGSLQAAIDRFTSLGGSAAFREEDLYARAEDFSRNHFVDEMSAAVARAMSGDAV